MHVGIRTHWLTGLVIALALIITAGAAHAQVFNSTPNLPIPDGPAAGISDTIAVGAGPASISSIRVGISISHTWGSDLQVYLCPPGVTWNGAFDAAGAAATPNAIDLTTSNGGNGTFYSGTEFTGSADPNFTPVIGPITAGVSPYTGLYTPEDLAEFNALYTTNGNGNWQLVVFDSIGADTGTLQSWFVEFGAPAGDPEIDVQRPAGTSKPSGSIDNAGAGVINTPMVLTYTVENQGAANTLNITNIAISNEVRCTAVPSTTSLTVAPASTDTFTVTFTPTAGGVSSCDVTITNDDANEGTYVITINVTSPLSGTYTINNDPAANADYQDIGAAMTSLETLGVSGAVTFNIFDDNGPYTSSAAYLLSAVAGMGAANPITFQAANGESPVIQGGGANNSLSLCGILIQGCTHVTIQGIEFDGLGTARHGVGVYGAGEDSTNITVRRCILHGFFSAALVWYEPGVAGSKVANGRVENCVVYGGQGNSVGFPRGSGIYMRRAAQLVAVHNTFIHDNPGTTVIVHEQGTAGEEAATFSNNIIYANRGTAAYDQQNAGPVAANNNLWYMGNGVAFGVGGPTTFAGWQAAGKDSNGLVADPAMFDPLVGDYHVGFGSPAVDAAVGGFGVTTDIEGTTRPIGPTNDIGADEFDPANTPAEITVQYRGASVADGGSVNLGNLGEAVGMSFTFTVKNVGGAALTVGNVTVSNETNCTASVTTQPTSPVAAGSSTTFVLLVTATTAGNPVSFDISFTNSDPNENPFDISFTGQAIAPAPEISVQRPALTPILNAGTDAVGRIAAGQATVYTYTIENIGSADLTITGNVTANAGVGTPTVAISQQPATPVTAQSTTTFDLSVTPAIGAFSLTVTIQNNDPVNGTFTFTVSGTGGLAGTYTINNDPAANPDFDSFGTAFSSLETNGVAGPVIFEVYDDMGPYTSAGLYALNAIPNQSALNTIVFRPAAGERPVVQGGGAASGSLGNCGILLHGCHYVTIEGIEFNGNGTANHGVAIHGSFLIGSLGNRIKGCWVHDTVGAGIVVHNDQPTGSCADSWIGNNMVYNCQGTAIGLVRGIYYQGDAKDVVIVHNTFVNNSSNVPTIVHDGFAGAGGGGAALRFSNNIIYANAGPSAYDSDGTHPAGGNGNMWHLGTGVAFGGGAVTYATWQGMGLDAAGSLNNPIFRDPGSNDYRIAPNSPAIDSAVALTPSIDSDIDGDIRPIGNGRDVGADEFNPNGPVEIVVTYRGSNVADGSAVAIGNLGAGVGMSFTFTIANVGGSTLNLPNPPTISNETNCSVSITTVPATTVASGATTSLVLNVTATTAGNPISFDISFDNSDATENPFDISVTGSAVTPAPEISVQRPANNRLTTPATINVGNLPVNGSFNYEFVVENVGSAQLNLTGTPAVSPTVNSGSITVGVNQPGSVALGVQQSTTFSVDVQPTLAGPFSLTLTITSNDAGVPTFTININGTAVDQPYLQVQGTLAFGSLIVGQNNTAQLTLNNIGSQPLSVTAINLFNANFAVAGGASPPFTIVAGGNEVLTFRFQPSAVGTFNATLTIVSDSGGVAGTVTTVNFTGTGTTGSGTVTKKKGCGVTPDGEQNALILAVLALMMVMLVIRRRQS